MPRKNSSAPQSAPSLLQLPDSCLEAVLRYCADDPRSLFSAARTHSRLHQAAVQAASSIRVVGCTKQRGQTQKQWQRQQQRQLDSVLRYLTNQQHHVTSLEFDGGTLIGLEKLPHDRLQGLSRLSFTGVDLKLQPLWPRSWRRGVVPSIKQLRIHMCTLMGNGKGRAVSAALARLPGLEHFSLVMPLTTAVRFHSDVLKQLPQLTYLELAGVKAWGDTDSMWHLQAVTGLQELRLDRAFGNSLRASMLSVSQHLTALKLDRISSNKFELEVLAGKPYLQHIELTECSMLDVAGTAELLSHLQQMQQLTHLNLRSSLRIGHANPPAAAYSALTASSKLQHLDISSCTLPTGAWHQLFPAGRQLPQLQALHVSKVRCSGFAAPEGSLLASCCPGLQVLNMRDMQYSAELLAPLAELSGLHELQLQPVLSSSEGLEVVCQLTGLRRLTLWDPSEEAMLLQLTALKHLTQLRYRAPRAGPPDSPDAVWDGEFWVWEWAPDGEPVWQQVAQEQGTDSDSDSIQ